MREKLAIANQLRISRKNYSNNIEHKKLCSKCYHAYVVECIIRGKSDFKVSFGGKYIHSFLRRISDWFGYIGDIIYRFFLIQFTPKDDKTLKKYELIHFGVSKPIHPKIAKIPNEWCLYDFLEKNGFKIKEEHLYSKSTVYDVARA